MREIAPHTEGAVVGSAFMRLIEEQSGTPDLEERLEALAREFKTGLYYPLPGKATAEEQ